MRPPSSPLFVLVFFLARSRSTTADSSTDASRTGTYYTPLPLYRSGAGTNVFTVGIGTPPANVNLTVSTNVEFVMVASSSCTGCSDNDLQINTASSSSFTPTGQALAYKTLYPTGSSDELLLTGLIADDIITDARQDTVKSRPIIFLTSVQDDSSTNTGTSRVELSDGSSGFWGLGVYQPHPQWSILPSMLAVNIDNSPSNSTGFIVGFDIDNYTNTQKAQMGTVHWGAVPAESYQGSFNWLTVNPSNGAGWAFDVAKMRVGSTVIGTDQLYGTIDPGFDAIYVPTAVAEKVFATVSGASRDLVDTTRWNLPCDTNISMTIAISSHTYNLAASELVQPRDAAGETCWSSIVAWRNGSVAENLGEIRLGTPFMSNVYSALYYSTGTQYVGLAGKPNSVNALDVSNDGGSTHVNGKLAGILIGVLLPVLVFLFVGCYARNHSSFQSIWYRAIRRQHRAHTNAMIRAVTIPPPYAPGLVPPMMPVPMPMPYPMGAPYPGYMSVPGMMPRQGMFGPPAYQPPMQAQPSPQQYQQQQPMPQAIETSPRGHYSPRHHHSLRNPPNPSVFPSRSRQSHPSPSNQMPQNSGQRSVQWGNVGTAREHPTASSASDRLVRPTSYLGASAPEPWQQTGQRQESWLRGFSGAGQQNANRFPSNLNPNQTVQAMYSTSAPAAAGHPIGPGTQGHSGDSGKKWFNSKMEGYGSVPGAEGSGWRAWGAEKKSLFGRKGESERGYGSKGGGGGGGEGGRGGKAGERKRERENLSGRGGALHSDP